MESFGDVSNRKYIPCVIELSVGVDGTLLLVLCVAYARMKSAVKTCGSAVWLKDSINKTSRFANRKNKDEIVAEARDRYGKLQNHWNIYYKETGAIGNYDHRMDEPGTPFYLTVDFDSFANDTFPKFAYTEAI